MAEADAVERTRLQGTRLRRLREHSGLSKSALSSELGFGTTQAYDLYERGASIIRLDRVDVWANAFKMSRENFIATLLGDLEPWNPWSFRDALRGSIPESDIEEMAPRWEGQPILNQQSAVEAILQMAFEQRRDATKTSRETNRQ